MTSEIRCRRRGFDVGYSGSDVLATVCLESGFSDKAAVSLKKRENGFCNLASCFFPLPEPYLADMLLSNKIFQKARFTFIFLHRLLGHEALPAVENFKG